MMVGVSVLKIAQTKNARRMPRSISVVNNRRWWVVSDRYNESGVALASALLLQRASGPDSPESGDSCTCSRSPARSAFRSVGIMPVCLVGTAQVSFASGRDRTGRKASAQVTMLPKFCVGDVSTSWCERLAVTIASFHQSLLRCVQNFCLVLRESEQAV